MNIDIKAPEDAVVLSALRLYSRHQSKVAADMLRKGKTNSYQAASTHRAIASRLITRLEDLIFDEGAKK